MSTTRDPETILTAWLDEGPTALPDVTQRAIVAAIAMTPQARRGLLAPRGTHEMTRSILLAAGIVLVVAAGALVLGVARGPSVGSFATPSASAPVSTTSPSTATSEVPMPTTAIAPSASPYAVATLFTSAIYAYSATIPAGWEVIPAVRKWDGAGSFSYDDPVVDQILPPEMENRCANVALCAPLMWAVASPTSKDLSAWAAALAAAETRDHACPPPESSSSTTIDGQPAMLVAKHCPATDGALILSGLAVRGGVGYAFYLQENWPQAKVEQLDRSDFVAFLKTVLLGG